MNQGKGQRFPRDTQEVAQKERVRSGKRWPVVLAKVLLVPILLFFSLVVGLMIGYGVVGDKPSSEVFDLGTYQHMYDLLFADTE
ncbi:MULTISPECIES: DNA-directed RNA polymerase subunit beta [Brevibacillus]|uniref:DNA-directed RNA polymerase subunit beta n=1 Tax=Brevibacillus invocatus TaxID=173959 RepID=A0A3M8CJI6_9BACL|nr:MULTISPECIES: DNA-directed RNA polymerase subunit beta [Brevibacillus]MCM3077490.1 DNA-directed RNA polymerase subunit beta [Brevibacillus invocatus]MCM3429673.1 DNA-directed RNA polymerase subunit beta [Brevibacillus invocatus]MDH4618008.1 DNA-directed RNA polymerase subunit beta [Brevibacillus sp. AY1]RNB75741.1 DNA-directed RNA polymerase subunit beta [Brevibacillus invocatus]